MRQASDDDVDQRRSRLIESACGKIYAGAPNFVDRVGNCVDHAGKSLDATHLAHRRDGRDRLDLGDAKVRQLRTGGAAFVGLDLS